MTVPSPITDLEIMAIAYAEAEEAFARSEYPVGAVLVRDGEITTKAGNRCVADVDPTAHGVS